MVRNVSVLAIGVDAEGFREVLGVSEGAKENKESWTAFLRELKEPGSRGATVRQRCNRNQSSLRRKCESFWTQPTPPL